MQSKDLASRKCPLCNLTVVKYSDIEYVCDNKNCQYIIYLLFNKTYIEEQVWLSKYVIYNNSYHNVLIIKSRPFHKKLLTFTYNYLDLYIGADKLSNKIDLLLNFK